MIKILIFMMLFTSCAHKPYALKELDSDKNEGEVVSQNRNQKIILSDKNELYLIEEKSLVDTYQSNIVVIDYIKDKVDSTVFQLNQCRRDLADPRLSGRGKITPVKIDALFPESFETEVGLNEDNVPAIIKRENVVKKFKKQILYQKSLQSILTTVKDQLDDCEFDLRLVRMKHGLTPAPVMPEGYFTSTGVWVETKPGEANLDQGFEIMASRKK